MSNKPSQKIRLFLSLIQKMNFIQEFTEHEMAKNMSTNILEQLQTCHSAVEQLICNLEALRSSPKLHIITIKIERFEAYLTTKQELLNILRNNNDHPIIEWLINNKIESPLIIELINKQQKFVKELLQKAVKEAFLNDQSLQQFLEENEMVNNCIGILKTVKEDISSGKTPSRQKIKSIDGMQGIIQQKIQLLAKKIKIFNLQIEKIASELINFQPIISHQFQQHFARDSRHQSSKLNQNKTSNSSSKINGGQNLYTPSFNQQLHAKRYSLKKQGSNAGQQFIDSRSSFSKIPTKDIDYNLGLQSRINMDSKIRREGEGQFRNSNSSFSQMRSSNAFR